MFIAACFAGIQSAAAGCPLLEIKLKQITEIITFCLPETGFISF
jgi:hypothetical protein